MNRKIRIISLTPAGFELAEKLQLVTPDADIWHKPKPFADKVQHAFSSGDALILICAMGIVVRTLAPVLGNKHEDPPVLVLDEQGQFVIPLLSGHEGGANNWANSISKLLPSQLVITTAKKYLQPVYTIGMGCERGCSESHLTELFDTALAQANLQLKDINSLCSIDIKSDEVGLIALASTKKIPFITYEKSQLANVEHLLSTKSEYVYKTVGVYGVAESAALLAAQSATQIESELVLNKIKTAKATCAIARSYFNQTDKP